MPEANLATEEAIEELRKKINSTNEKHVFVVYDMQANSWSGKTTMESIHETLEGAIASLPDWCKKMQRDLYGDWVANFTYFAVKRVRLER